MVSIPSSERLGMIYFESYQYDKALYYFKKVSSINENNIPTLKKLKEYFLIKGEVTEALEVQKKLIHLRPKNIEYLVELEQLFDWSQQPINKLKTMRLRADLLNDNQRIQLYSEILNGFRWLRNYEESDKIAKFVTIDPQLKKSQELIKSVIDYYMATKKSQEAIHLLELRVIENPEDSKSLEWLAETYRIENDFEKSIITMLRLLDVKDIQISSERSLISLIHSVPLTVINERTHLLYQILDSLIKLKKKKDVQDLREFLFQLFPDEPEVRFSLAEAYFENKDFDQALPLYLGIEKMKKFDPDIFHQAAIRLVQMSRHQDSLRFYERLYRLFPNRLQILEEYGDVLESTGQKNKALEIYFKILEIKKRRSSSISNDSVLLVSNELQMVPNFAKLKTHPIFQKDLQVDRVKLKILNLADQLEDKVEKLKILNKMINDNPNDILLLKRLGYLYFELGEDEKAYKVFDFAHSIHPADLDILEVIIRKDLLEKNLSRAQLNIDRLKISPHYDDIYEEFLFIKNSGEHKNHCKNYILNSGNTLNELEIRTRCHFRLSEYSKSLSGAVELINNDPKNLSYRFMHLSSCLELRDINCAETDIARLKELGVSGDQLVDYESYLLEIKVYIDKRDSFEVESFFRFVNYDNWNVFEENLQLKKFFLNYFFGVEFNHHHYSQIDERTWKGLGAFIGFRGEKFNFDFGSDFYKNDINFTKPRSSLSIFASDSFINLEWNGITPLTNSEALVENHARKSEFLLYFEKYWKKSFLFTYSMSSSNIKSDNGAGRQMEFRSDFLFAPKSNGEFYFGPVMGYSSLNNSSGIISEGFINKSKSYGITLMGRTPLESRLTKRVGYLIKLDVLGDLERDINLSKIIILSGELSYNYGEDKALKVNAFSSQESYLGVKGDTFGGKLTWNHWW